MQFLINEGYKDGVDIDSFGIPISICGKLSLTKSGDVIDENGLYIAKDGYYFRKNNDIRTNSQFLNGFIELTDRNFNGGQKFVLNKSNIISFVDHGEYTLVQANYCDVHSSFDVCESYEYIKQQLTI